MTVNSDAVTLQDRWAVLPLWVFFLFSALLGGLVYGLLQSLTASGVHLSLSAGANYTIEAGVQGTVTASLTDVSFRTALESVLRTAQSQIPLTYRVENGVYNVGLRREKRRKEPSRPGKLLRWCRMRSRHR